MADARPCDGWKPFFAMLTIEFSFAVVNILLKIALDEGTDHLVLITYRLSIAAAFLGPISYFGEKNSRPKLTFRILSFLFISAIVGASLTQYCFLLGIQYTSATFASAFINMVPVITFIMALPFGLETVNIKSNGGKAKVAGTLVCVGGAMVLTLYKGTPLFNHPQAEATARAMEHGSTGATMMHHHSQRGERWTAGCISLVAGTTLWSSWFILQSKIGKTYPCQYTTTAIMCLFGAIQSGVLCLGIERGKSKWVLKGKLEIITVLYAGMVGSGLGYVGMAWCVKKRGPVFTAAFSPLVQIMAAFIDIPFLHDHFPLGSLVGSIIVIIGLYIVLWGKKKEIQNHARKVVAQEAPTSKPQDLLPPPPQHVTVPCDSR